MIWRAKYINQKGRIRPQGLDFDMCAKGAKLPSVNLTQQFLSKMIYSVFWPISYRAAHLFALSQPLSVF